jgi:hypothetical protein
MTKYRLLLSTLVAAIAATLSGSGAKPGDDQADGSVEPSITISDAARSAIADKARGNGPDQRLAADMPLAKKGVFARFPNSFARGGPHGFIRFMNKHHSQEQAPREQIVGTASETRPVANINVREVFDRLNPNKG